MESAAIIAEPDALAISARTGQGCDALLARMDRDLALDPVSTCVFRIPAGEGSPLHLLHQFGRVLSTRYDGDVCEVKAEVPASLRRRLRDYAI